MNDAHGVQESSIIMTNITYLKCVLLGLLIVSTTTVIFYAYVSSIYQMESEQAAHTGQPLVFREIFNEDTGHILLTRMTDIARQTRVQEVCRHQPRAEQPVEDNLELQDHIIVDDTHKLLYCYVPKVACTNWKRVLMILQKKTNITNVIEIPASLAHSQGMFMKLTNYSAPEIRNIIHNYTKFIFVRHPFERVLSAYRNKLEQHYESSKYFQQRYGRYIVKHYRTNASQESLLKGDDVTFKEFSSYLTDKNAVFNEHWKPIHQLCQPCQINYDIIGKYDTLQDDAEFVLRHIGQTQIQFPKLPKPSSTMSLLQQYFRSLPRETVKRLYDIYSLDFQLFGYDIEGIMDQNVVPLV